MFFPQFAPGVSEPMRSSATWSGRPPFRLTTSSIRCLFSAAGRGTRKECPPCPASSSSQSSIVEEAQAAHEQGVPAVLLFGIPEKKDAVGRGAYAKDGIIQETIRELKKEAAGLAVVTDVCMCEYTDHGHCGIIRYNDMDNDATLSFSQEALSHAQAGADTLARPNDGRPVDAIRRPFTRMVYHFPIMS